MMQALSQSRANRSALALFFLVSFLNTLAFAGTATVTVDFTSIQRTLSPLTFSMDESGYGSSLLPQDMAQQNAIKTLKVAMMRMNLGYTTPCDSTSKIVCMASGCNQTNDGSAWINAIKAAGAAPVIRVQMNLNYQSCWATDAANLVKYFNVTTGNPVGRWIIGNEPDGNGIDVATYSNGFVSMYNAMKAVDSTIKIGGPATAYFNSSFLTTFFSNIGGQGITPDFADYHEYGTSQQGILDADLLSQTVKYENHPNSMRTLLVNQWGSIVGNQIPIEIGEWNLHTSSDVRQLENYNSVWSALALSHMVKAGVTGRQYADKNGPLGAVCDVANLAYGGVTYPCNIDDPLPIYHGIGMFTGESLFPSFGTSVATVTATSSTGLIDATASANPMNIVAINSSPTDTTTTTFMLTGTTSGAVTVWQKNGNNQAPAAVTTFSYSNGSFTYALGPYTVTTFLLTPSNLPPPPPAPTNLAATAGNAQVALSWTASTGAANYNVKRSTTTGGPYSTIASPVSTNYTDTAVTNGTTYYYVVTAVNSNGESGNSNEVSATPTGGTSGPILYEAESLTVAASSGQTWRTSTDSSCSGGVCAFFDATAVGNYVTLTVNVAQAGTYDVQIGTKLNTTRGIFQLATATTTNGTYTNQGAPQDQYGAVAYTFQDLGNVTFNTASSTMAFRFTVTGKNSASSGYGLCLDYIKLIPVSSGGAPPAPASLTATAGDTEVSLSWSVSSGATSYNVKRATTSGGPYTTITTAGAQTALSYSDISLTNGTTYYYVVTAVNSNGESANSNQASAAPAANNTLIYQVESLAIGASSGKTATTITDANCNAGQCVSYAASATGDYITFVVDVPQARTYDIRVGVKQNSGEGIFQFATATSVGGSYTDHGSAQDLYSASAAYAEVDIGNVVFGSAGTSKGFRFTVTGKNASSSGYSLSLDYIKLIPQ